MNCGTTHHEGCPCHEAAEIERLRERVAELEGMYENVCEVSGQLIHKAEGEAERLKAQAAINQEHSDAWRRRWDHMREIATENKSEIDRLRDGIREHREATDKAMSHDWELWALLEENHDDR